MDLGLRGKKAIVTGGKRGLGFAIATLLAKEGADIAICARGDVSESVTALSAYGTKVVGAGIDAANGEEYKAWLKTASDQLGGWGVFFWRREPTTTRLQPRLVGKEWSVFGQEISLERLRNVHF